MKSASPFGLADFRLRGNSNLKMEKVVRQVLMGDPRHFSIRGGANPHTRDKLGRRKTVDRERAIRQWYGLAALLSGHGVEVFVLPPDAEHPGLVYPANAGFLPDVDQAATRGPAAFCLSHLLPSRFGEREHYEDFLQGLGFRTHRVEHRFEGEADFFPFRDAYLLTFGRIERQRFVPRWGWPPYRRVYGFRTDRSVRGELSSLVPGRPIIELELMDERHYHGDTALCAFGPGRRYLLAFLDALAEPARECIRQLAGDGLVSLSSEDASIYAANSFYLESGEQRFLFMPRGVSDRLAERVRDLGVQPVLVEVSEFMAKGGGSVKCMIGDLGAPGSDVSPEAQVFRERHLYKADRYSD